MELDLQKQLMFFGELKSQYLTSTSDFAVLADALEAASADLIGINY